MHVNEVSRKRLEMAFNDLGPISMEFSEGDIEPTEQAKVIFAKYMAELKFDLDSLDNLTQVCVFFIYSKTYFFFHLLAILLSLLFCLKITGKLTCIK